jgi:hypothetical protein
MRIDPPPVVVDPCDHDQATELFVFNSNFLRVKRGN